MALKLKPSGLDQLQRIYHTLFSGRAPPTEIDLVEKIQYVLEFDKVEYKIVKTGELSIAPWRFYITIPKGKIWTIIQSYFYMAASEVAGTRTVDISISSGKPGDSEDFLENIVAMQVEPEDIINIVTGSETAKYEDPAVSGSWKQGCSAYTVKTPTRFILVGDMFLDFGISGPQIGDVLSAVLVIEEKESWSIGQ